MATRRTLKIDHAHFGMLGAAKRAKTGTTTVDETATSSESESDSDSDFMSLCESEKC